MENTKSLVKLIVIIRTLFKWIGPLDIAQPDAFVRDHGGINNIKYVCSTDYTNILSPTKQPLISLTFTVASIAVNMHCKRICCVCRNPSRPHQMSGSYSPRRVICLTPACFPSMHHRDTADMKSTCFPSIPNAHMIQVCRHDGTRFGKTTRVARLATRQRGRATIEDSHISKDEQGIPIRANTATFPASVQNRSCKQVIV